MREVAAAVAIPASPGGRALGERDEADRVFALFNADDEVDALGEQARIVTE
ncbi:MAG: hypothetical protein ACOCW3_02090 [Spirochaetota bacterium]